MRTKPESFMARSLAEHRQRNKADEALQTQRTVAEAVNQAQRQKLRKTNPAW